VERGGPFAVTEADPAGELHRELPECMPVLLGNYLNLGIYEVLYAFDERLFVRIGVLEAVYSAIKLP
jgi:hypothetical protein